MRWIFRYTPEAEKYLAKLLKKKMPKSEPWLHVAVKTMSARNPWSGAVVYVWDTRQVIWEYRSNKDKFTTDMFTKDASGMSRANDNRQPLQGGRADINEYFEFGKEFDASKGDAFDGKDRVKFTKLYAKKSAKHEPKPGNEAKMYNYKDKSGNLFYLTFENSLYWFANYKNGNVRQLGTDKKKALQSIGAKHLAKSDQVAVESICINGAEYVLIAQEAMIPYDKVKPGMIAYHDNSGEYFEVIAKAKAKNFAKIKQYDDSGAMQDDIDNCDPEDGLIAVKSHDGYPSVWLYDTSGAYVDTDEQKRGRAMFNKMKKAK
jgi:hypothetical protein